VSKGLWERIASGEIKQVPYQPTQIPSAIKVKLDASLKPEPLMVEDPRVQRVSIEGEWVEDEGGK
jgi:hypothetical protein